MVQFAICNLQFAICNFFLLSLFAFPALAAGSKKVVIPFDFVSDFDQGRYGQMLGEAIWKKLSRQGGFVIPESMLEVRDYCTSHKLKPSPETDLEKMRQIVEGDFDAQIGIWGSVERAPGADGEIYDLVIKCVDFSARPRPKVIYESKARTRSVSEIPHVYVAQMLDALYGRKPGAPPAPIPLPTRTGRRTRTSWPAISNRAPTACPRAGTLGPASSASRWAGWSAG